MLAGLSAWAMPALAQPEAEEPPATVVAAAVETGHAILRLLDALPGSIAGRRVVPLDELAVLASTRMGLACHAPDNSKPRLVCDLGPSAAGVKLTMAFEPPFNNNGPSPLAGPNPGPPPLPSQMVRATLWLTPVPQVQARQLAALTFPAWREVRTERCRTQLWRLGPGPETQTTFTFESDRCTGLFSHINLYIGWTPFNFPAPVVN